ncbi:hypothetical protein QPM17_06525 [Marinobacter sp. TBZ242]|uniref:Uncharacterized protein n=1 Tax=Marinobacter azerbaijanicus TaxID=3050455 RepID=A0ABT7ICB3_9GAMM|nr:hypothetical protein [Marinobacter sp. TBZ242]MDL0430769.1 hypothetical protein [Marinobacter sp. TBZ242]
MIRNIRIRWLAPAIFSVLLAVPTLSHAQDDLDVTMRMVTDDQELDDSFVQQLELPEFADTPAAADEFGDMQTDLEDFAAESREDMLDIEDSLSEQSRESRDALGIELPGELIEDDPELDLPGLEDPGLELPGTDDTDLDLLDDETLNLEDTEL